MLPQRSWMRGYTEPSGARTAGCRTARRGIRQAQDGRTSQVACSRTRQPTPCCTAAPSLDLCALPSAGLGTWKASFVYALIKMFDKWVELNGSLMLKQCICTEVSSPWNWLQSNMPFKDVSQGQYMHQ